MIKARSGQNRFEWMQTQIQLQSRSFVVSSSFIHWMTCMLLVIVRMLLSFSADSSLSLSHVNSIILIELRENFKTRSENMYKCNTSTPIKSKRNLFVLCILISVDSAAAAAYERINKCTILKYFCKNASKCYKRSMVVAEILHRNVNEIILPTFYQGVCILMIRFFFWFVCLFTYDLWFFAFHVECN